MKKDSKTTPSEKPKLIHNAGEYDDENLEFCDRCQNTGSVSCYCGGDQCYCENQGETFCPHCEMGLEYEP